MKNLFLPAIAAAALALGFYSSALNAADETVGRLFIKTADSTTGGQQAADPKLAEAVTNMKAKPGKFVVVDDESQADFLLVVLGRKSEQRKWKKQPLYCNTLLAALSIRNGASWKPLGTVGSESRLLDESATDWKKMAEDLIVAAERYTKKPVGK